MKNETPWKYFERIVAAIHHAESQGATVVWNDTIGGRQFDVTVRFKYGLHEYLTVIECKKHSKKIPVEKVDALATKARDANANKAIIVSSSGFQSGCTDVAKRHGIKLLTLNEKVQSTTDELIAEVKPALAVYDVRIKQDNPKNEYLLEDIGGKLHYLMQQIKIESKGISKSPDQIIQEWQLTKPEISMDTVNEVAIPLPEKSLAHIPNENSINTTHLLFKCEIIKAFVAEGPFLDNHIRKEYNTGYELIDENGNITHSVNQSELEIGFDTTFEEGKFYEAPKLYNSYFCEKIEENIASLILIESYQHGKLLQARLKLDVKFSGHYIEITNKKTLSHLKALLEKFKR